MIEERQRAGGSYAEGRKYNFYPLPKGFKVGAGSPISPFINKDPNKPAPTKFIYRGFPSALCLLPSQSNLTFLSNAIHISDGSV